MKAPKDGSLLIHTPFFGLIIDFAWLWWGRKTTWPVWSIKWNKRKSVDRPDRI